jgi:histidine triad (HIT) family protein
MPMTPAEDDRTERVDCPFCLIVRGEGSAKIVFQDADVVAFFPTEPAILGHTLVIPTRHVKDVWGLPVEEATPLWQAVLGLAHAVRRAMKPDGLNIINSAGDAASQTIFHLHLHVVPRWYGDPIGNIWPPPNELWSGDAQDEALDELRAACRTLRL